MTYFLKFLATIIVTGVLLSVSFPSGQAGQFIHIRKTVSVNGKTLSQPYAFVASDGSNETTYMPIWYVGQALQAAGFSQSWDGGSHTWTLTTSQGDFGSLPEGKGSANIVLNGRLIKRLNTYVALDPAGGNKAQPTVYMPIYYIQQIFQAAGIQSTWNGQSWSIASSKTKPIVFGFVTNYGGSTDSLSDLKAHPDVTELSTFTHSIAENGGLVGTLFMAAGAYGASKNFPAYVTITNLNVSSGTFDGPLAHRILNNPSESQALIQNITDLLAKTPFTGINLDFEMLPASDRTVFTQFLSGLSQRLHATGKQLSVDVPAVTNDTSAYDYAAIGRTSDQVILMAYDYSYPGGPAGPIAPVWWVNQVLAYTTKSIAANKVLLGLPAYGYDWFNGKTQALKLPAIDQLIATRSIAPQWDATDEAPYFTYTTNQTTHTVYYENAQSIQDKLKLAQQYHLLGVALWHMGTEDQAIWTPIQQYLVSP